MSRHSGGQPVTLPTTAPTRGPGGSTTAPEIPSDADGVSETSRSHGCGMVERSEGTIARVLWRSYTGVHGMAALAPGPKRRGVCPPHAPLPLLMQTPAARHSNATSLRLASVSPSM